MKQVIIKTPTPTDIIDASDVSVAKCYAVLVNKREFGIVSRDQFETGNFNLLAAQGISNGNTYCTFTSQSLVTLVRACICMGHSVFEFDSFKEMCKFIAEYSFNE